MSLVNQLNKSVSNLRWKYAIYFNESEWMMCNTNHRGVIFQHSTENLHYVDFPDVLRLLSIIVSNWYKRDPRKRAEVHLGKDKFKMRMKVDIVLCLLLMDYEEALQECAPSKISTCKQPTTENVLVLC